MRKSLEHLKWDHWCLGFFSFLDMLWGFMGGTKFQNLSVWISAVPEISQFEVLGKACKIQTSNLQTRISNCYNLVLECPNDLKFGTDIHIHELFLFMKKKIFKKIQNGGYWPVKFSGVPKYRWNLVLNFSGTSIDNFKIFSESQRTTFWLANIKNLSVAIEFKSQKSTLKMAYFLVKFP